MNAYYAKLQARLSPTSRAMLAGSQRNWAAYRDAWCKLEGTGSEGGTVQPWVILSCRADFAKQRAKELKGYVVCEDGDLSCPE